jgi:hypothetical protein
VFPPCKNERLDYCYILAKELFMKKLFLMLFLNALILGANAADHIIKVPDELKWTEGPKSLPSGAQVSVMEGDPAKKGPFTLRLKLPADYTIMPHWHPGIEHVTVIEGEFYMGTGEKLDKSKAHSLPEGGFAVMPVRFRHFAFTANQIAVIQLHGVGPWDIIYVDPENDPRKKE